MNALAAIQIDGRVASLVIDFPPVNALSQPVREAIVAQMTRLGARDDVDAIILRCAGRTFVAGADISEFGRPIAAPDFNDVVAALEDCPKLVVAALHGTTLGGGLEVALGAHYRVALDGSRLGFPEIALGLLPGAGGTQRGPRAIDAQAAFDLIAGGKPVDAAGALRLGLVDHVVASDLASEVVAYARGLLERGAPLRRLRDEAPRVADPAVLEARLGQAETARSPAMRGCAAAMRAALSQPFSQGLVTERAIFDALMDGAESRALRHIFFAERAAGKLTGSAAAAAPRAIERVGVIGAGTMGGGIAMAFLDKGMPVTLVERDREALDRGIATIRRNYEGALSKGRLTRDAVDQRIGLIMPALDLAAVGDCDLVIEAAFESMNVKRDIFARLDGIARPGAILATNTSFLDVDAIAAATGRPQDVLGLHFFSPANVMKLLEVVRGERTGDGALASAMALAKRLGKTAVVSRVCHGFIANRIMDVRRVQAERLLLRGASVQSIDEALVDYGFPMGQFAMMDLVGLDVMGRDSDERTLMGDFVAAGRLGQKSGAGYYDYDDRRRPRPSEDAGRIVRAYAAHRGVEQQADAPEAMVARLLYPVVNEGARLIEEAIVQRASDIDVAVIAGYGWPAWAGGPIFWGDEVGLARIVGQLDRFADEGDETLRPCALLRACADEGRRLGTLMPATGR